MSDPVVSGEPPRSPETPALAPAPEVSVLVRSMGRASLAEALASVARQSFSDLEVVVVAASGQPHPPLPAQAGRLPIRLIEPGLPLSRPAAANAALRAARGRWLIFLDDDDLFDADHIERLHAALRADPAACAAYAGVRLIDRDGHAASELDEDFDSVRLWLANYLPMHAVLFSREVVDRGQRFDESFAVYEDWDFWRELSLERRWIHVPGVSATYRLQGSSGLSHDGDARIAAQGRERFYRKWLPRLSARQLTEIATAAEHHRVAVRELDRRSQRLQSDLSSVLAESARLEAERSSAIAQGDELARQIASLGAQMLALSQSRDSALRQAEDLSGRLVDVQQQLAATRADYQRLEAGYLQVVHSLSWRLTAPLRALRGLASAAGVQRLARAAARQLPMPAAQRLRLKARLASMSGGPHVLRWLASPAPASQLRPGPDAPAIDKEAVRAAAEDELTRFLAGSARIDLSPSCDSPQISVVVVLFNQAGLSLLCLQALAASRGVSFETLIVDNASSDRVPALLGRVDGAKVLPQRENLGFLRAVNLAAGSARGRYLLLLNNDALVEPDTLRDAAARLDAEADAGAAGGPILLWDGRLQEAGSIVWRDGSCQGYGRGDSPDRPEYRFVRDVDYCSGAFLLVRRELFERLGRFDEAYAPAYYEESDFCVRLWEAGHRVVYDPKLRIKHFEFASDTGSTRALELQARHRQRFADKHRGYLARRPERSQAALLDGRAILRAGAPRVLIVDDRVPYPALGRGYPRASMLARSVAARAASLTYVPLVFPDGDWRHVFEALDEHTEVMLGLGVAGLGDFLASRIGRFDLILVSRPHNMQVVDELRQGHPQWFASAKLVYDAEALFSLREIERSRVLGPAMSGARARALLDHELELAARADRIVAVSEAEARHYRASGRADVVVLGHALDVRPSPTPFERRSGFLFVGAITEDACPNGDSLRWFASQVWPAVCAALGEQAVLDVVGVCESEAVHALASTTIRFHGRVDRLDSYFDARRVFVVPTRFAAGVPHKAHEAASRGLPMVTSALIASQLGWRDELLVGHDAASFADACIRLHEDASLWQGLRAGLLAAVERDCSVPAFEAAVDRMLA